TEQIGTPAEIYARPATAFVAGFIGSPPMNLLPATVAGDGRTLAVDGATVALPQSYGALAGRALLFGGRPEHLRLGGDAFDMEVQMVELLGADHLVHGRLGAHEVIVRAAADAPPEVGSRVRVGFEAAAVHWFERERGTRIDG
ncbi:MAG: TOBE domain-containing protein, partial [Burkholderiaceae bacterium]|nr:TOBE domain-containing protein [Burkholderiaceae bacterium]